LLSDRHNVVVIADEAHRSQYGLLRGLARHMRDALPGASFIGFTGTPIELGDRSTPALFGDYIDTYDVLQAVDDRATVPIYYESRLARIELDEDERPRIDPEFEEVTEQEEVEGKHRLRRKWTRLEAMVGAEKRLKLVAADLLEHLDRRLDAMDGKAMLVCMSRRICADMYDQLTALRPEWHSEDDERGAVKLVMSGSATDPPEWQRHVRSKGRNDAISRRLKDPADPLKIVVVRDMWLTGFDCPPLHTMYLDKAMTGHNLMQAIARVNRVFRDKPGGLVVDYIGVAEPLTRAMADYTAGGGTGKPKLDQAEAVAVMCEKYEVIVAMYHGFDYLQFLRASAASRLRGIVAAMEHVLGLEEGKPRYLRAVGELSKAFALAVPHEEAMAIRDELALFQEVRAALRKATAAPPGERTPEEIDTALRQLVSRAISGTGVVDIFAAAGLERPDISLLSEEFLEEVRRLPQRNLAVEMLEKLLRDEVRTVGRRNVVQSRSFAEMLEETIRKYHNRTVQAARVIEELIELAREMREARGRGEDLGLTDEEVAFYDALEVKDSAVAVLGDETLRTIAQELVRAVRKNVSTDWALRESARARIRVIVRRILRKYGYPPHKREKATLTVLEQAEVLCGPWAA
jgi:type I restriction enzyme R subunit